VAALLDDAPTGQHEDPVGEPHGRHPVRDEDRDSTDGRRDLSRGRLVRVDEPLLGQGVEGCGGLVEHEQERVGAHEGAREPDGLPLAARQVLAVGVPEPEHALKSEAVDGRRRAGTVRRHGDSVRGVHVRELAYAHAVLQGQLDPGEVLEQGRRPSTPVGR
jgi:hypothetical protein